MIYLRTGATGHAIRESWTKAAFAVVCVCGVIITANDAVAAAPPAFARLRGQVTISATATLTGLAVAYLVFGRYRYRRLVRDLALSTSLLLLASGNLVFTVLPGVLGRSAVAGAPLAQEAVAIVVGFVLAASTLLGDRQIAPAAATGATVLSIVSATLVFIASLLLADRAYPHVGVAATVSGDVIGASPFLTDIQLGVASLFAVAALGWLRQALSSGDSLASTLALGCAMSAVSRLNFALATSPSSERVITGSMFRLGFYLLLLAGSAEEIRTYWHERAERAVLEERRRISRDLHDGLAQELAFLAKHARNVGSGEGRLVAAAAERALDESRRAIAALSRPLDEPLDVTLTQAAEEVAVRVGIRVGVDAERGLKVTPEQRETLVRIVREALSNAGRHGRATSALVQLSGDRGIKLSVLDNGLGFDESTIGALPGKFGLVGMRERAEAIGGEVVIRSAPARGTRVTVRLP